HGVFGAEPHPDVRPTPYTFDGVGVAVAFSRRCPKALEELGAGLGEQCVVDRILGFEVGVEGLGLHTHGPSESSQRQARHALDAHLLPGGPQDLLSRLFVAHMSPVPASLPSCLDRHGYCWAVGQAAQGLGGWAKAGLAKAPRLPTATIAATAMRILRVMRIALPRGIRISERC